MCSVCALCTGSFFFSSRRRHTRCALVTGVQTCALPIWSRLVGEAPETVIVCLEPQPIELAEGYWLLPAPLQYKRTQDDPTTWFDHAETPDGAKRIGLAHGPILDFGSSAPAANLIAPDRARREIGRAHV